MISNEKLVAFIKGNPVVVICAVLAVLLIAGSYFRSSSIPESESLLEERSALGQRIDANITNGVQLTEQLAALVSAREDIENRMVKPDELAKNQQYFYKLETETGVKLVGLRQNPIAPAKPGAPASKNAYFPVGYEVVARGDYEKVLDFLRRLEAGQRYCRVNSASLTLVGDASKDRSGDVNIILGLELLGQP
jgi:hypothetical protein